MESGVRCQIEVAQADSSACIGSCGCSGFPLAAVDAVAALAAVDAVVALAAVEAHPYRDGFLMEASQGEAVVARAVYLQKSWPLLQGFRFLRCCVSGYAIFYAIACHLMYHYCVQ